MKAELVGRWLVVVILGATLGSVAVLAIVALWHVILWLI